jgi:DNA excision repair protein ERCC-3
MEGRTSSPLIVQGDRTIFLEVSHPSYEEVRARLAGFAELEKSPEYVHVYRITPLSLWNAASAGLSAEGILDFLQASSRYPVPQNLRKDIVEFMGRYGRLSLRTVDGRLELFSEEENVLREIIHLKHLEDYFVADAPAADPLRAAGAGHAVTVKPELRGQLKVALIKIGYPVDDVAGYRAGAPLAIHIRDSLAGGQPFGVRPYQKDAVDAFHAGGEARGGSGVIVLPCGAGKTIVGIGILEKVGSQALILTTNVTALRQWRRELLEKTTLEESMIGEYSGEEKEIRPITLTTYQMLTYRRSRTGELIHLEIFRARDWGLIIYDEVHLLPAPVFRLTAEIQATRRLGLTATLVREDGREDEVFSLIGPRRFDMPWRSLEAGGWIASARCVEVRVDMAPDLASTYATADRRGKFRLASENPEKLEVVRSLASRHEGDRVLIIGQYLEQLKVLRRELGAPLITGKTPQAERDELFASFRDGRIPVLIVSKVGNFAVDLPEANIAIQVSGTFGSRQEEAQRLGRILRPKKEGGAAVFYSVVTRGSRDQDFAEKRQLFLAEQGYHYTIQDTVIPDPATPRVGTPVGRMRSA